MHTYSHRVRYHEADGQSYLFNARYLEIADVAFTEFLRQIGLEFIPANASSFDPSVVSAELSFRSPARFDDVLDIDASVTHVGRSSFSLTYTITTAERHLSTMKLTYVNVDAPQARSGPLPSTVSSVLRDLIAK